MKNSKNPKGATSGLHVVVLGAIRELFIKSKYRSKNIGKKPSLLRKLFPWKVHSTIFRLRVSVP